MVSLLKGLSILLIFSKNQLLFFADSIVLLFPTSFISALMFILFIWLCWVLVAAHGLLGCGLWAP